MKYMKLYKNKTINTFVTFELINVSIPNFFRLFNYSGYIYARDVYF